MATKIQITADASQAKAEVAGLVVGLDGVGDQATQAAAETAAAGEKMEDALEEVQREAKATDNAIDRIGNTSSRITAVATSFTAVTQALQLAGRASGVAMRAIDQLAEEGSPAAIKLRDSIAGIQTALIELADDPALQNFGNQLAALGDKAAEGISNLPDLWRSAVNRISDDIVLASESLGLMPEGTLETLDEMQTAEQKAVEAAKERTAEEREKTKELEKQKKLAEETAKAEKEAAEEQSRQELEDFEYANQLAEEEFAKENARIAELAKQEQEAHERRMEEIRREQEAKDERHKKALEQAGAIKELERQVNDPNKITERLAANRGKQAEQEALSRGATEREAAQAAERARRQAFRDARRQQQGGREEFSREEIQQAQTDNAQATMGALRESGKLSEQTLQALQTSINEAQQQTVEMNALQDAVKELQRQAQAVAQDGARRRSQRNSNRQ